LTYGLLEDMITPAWTMIACPSVIARKNIPSQHISDSSHLPGSPYWETFLQTQFELELANFEIIRKKIRNSSNIAPMLNYALILLLITI